MTDLLHPHTKCCIRSVWCWVTTVQEPSLNIGGGWAPQCKYCGGYSPPSSPVPPPLIWVYQWKCCTFNHCSGMWTWGSEVLVSQLSCEFKEPVGDLTSLEAFQKLRYNSPGQNQVVAIWKLVLESYVYYQWGASSSRT